VNSRTISMWYAGNIKLKGETPSVFCDITCTTDTWQTRPLVREGAKKKITRL
jgi:hypothetical protein